MGSTATDVPSTPSNYRVAFDDSYGVSTQVRYCQACALYEVERYTNQWSLWYKRATCWCEVGKGTSTIEFSHTRRQVSNWLFKWT